LKFEGRLKAGCSHSLQTVRATATVINCHPVFQVFKGTSRRLKGYRRIFSRFEKLDLMFLGFISFALVADGMRMC
jgi:hypothetical protein